jgi:hypothetical protein
MIGWNVIVEVECVEQPVLIAAVSTYHLGVPSSLAYVYAITQRAAVQTSFSTE